jgi:hypothetical protein
MSHQSSQYSIDTTDDGRIDITTESIRAHFTEGVTLFPAEIEVFIKRVREVAHELRETRDLQ